LAKTVVGFVTGIIGSQFIVTQPLPRFVVFLGASLVHSLMFYGLYIMLGLWRFEAPYTAVLGQGVANSLIGIVAFQLAELLPGAIDRRRAGRPRLRR
jgi:hypothetical protein